MKLIPEEEVSYWLFFDQPQTLTGKRKYDCDVLAEVTGTVEEFLEVLELQLSNFRPHVAVRVHQNTQLKQLRTNPPTYLDPECGFAVADFSPNGIFREALKGTSKQWMQKREFSIENFLQWCHNGDGKLEETHQHYVTEDPKHDVTI